MNYKEIHKELDELNELELYGMTELQLEDILDKLDDFKERADSLNENDDSDGEYSEIIEMIEDLEYRINDEIDSLFNEEEDYDF